MSLLKYLNDNNIEYSFSLIDDSNQLNIYVKGDYYDARNVLTFTNDILLSLKKLNLRKCIINYRRMISPIVLCIEMLEK